MVLNKAQEKKIPPPYDRVNGTKKAPPIENKKIKKDHSYTPQPYGKKRGIKKCYTLGCIYI